MSRRIILGCFVLWALFAMGARALVISEPLPHADALLVLSGGAVYDERVRHAGMLFRRGKGDVVLLTNDGLRRAWSQELGRNPSSVEQAILALEAEGVSTARIHVLPGVVRGTSDEARAVSEYARRHRLRSILAVTSPYHTRRTLWTLRRFVAGRGVVVGVESVPVTRATPAASTWWTNRQGWRTVGGEFVKLPYYWVRFSLPMTSAD